MSTLWLLVGYCIVVAMASFAGGWLPTLLRMTHLRTQLLMSFVAGLMLGIASMHLMPHSSEMLGNSSKAGAATLGGIIGMFLLLRAFHTHHHGASPPGALPFESLPSEAESLCAVHAHDHDHEHAHDHAHDRKSLSSPQLSGDPVSQSSHGGSRSLGWMGILFGLGLHTMMDGVALAASVVADASHGAWLGLAGLGTFLAVALHKPLDAFSIGSVMKRSGWSEGGRLFVNMVFCLACPVGAMLFWFGATQLGSNSESVVGYGLAISAGFFICIALADLLPEVHFHDHDRGKLTLALFIGVLLAIGIENLPGHQHGKALQSGTDIHAGHRHDHPQDH